MIFKRLEEEEADFQMAPMIDIIFQLIIFFMCVTQLNKLDVPEGIKLPVAEQSMEKKGNPNQLTINVHRDGRILVSSNWYDDLDSLFAFLKKESKKDNLKIYIRGDKDTKFAKIMDVMRVCAEVNIWDVSFSTYQESNE